MLVNRLRLSSRVLLLVALPVVFQIISLAVMLGILRHVETVESFNQVVQDERDCQIIALQMGTNATISRPNLPQELHEAGNKLIHSIKILKKLHPDKVAQIAKLDQAAKNLLRAFDSLSGAQKDNAQQLPADEVIRKVAILEREFADRAAVFVPELTIGGVKVDERLTQSSRLMKFGAVSCLTVNMVLSLLLAISFNMNTTRRLLTLSENARRFGSGDPLLPPIEGDDEIRNVDDAFHNMAAALKKSEAEKRALEKMKQEIIAVISHELRTPLTSMRAFLTLLASNSFGVLSEDGQGYVQRMDQESVRLMRLINNFLDMERVDAGKLALRIAATSSKTVIERAVHSVAGFAEQSGVLLSCTNDEQVFQADEDRIVQVLVNLMSNAIKYSPKGAEVMVAVETTPEKISFKVIDQGCGIPAQHRAEIFEKFRQLEHTTRREGSTGLGLAISKAIVEQHGGEILVEGSSPPGSTFRFSIPISRS